MALQVRRAGAADYGRWAKALVVGDPGSGKTRSGSTWPDPLYANIEGGMMSVTDRQPPVLDVTSSHELTELLRTLEQNPGVREKILGVPTQTVIIDTIDQMARILIEERLTDQRKEVFAIQDWGWLGDQLRGIVRGFRNLDMHVIFNCHIKSQEDSETGRIIYKPAIQGAMGDEIAGYVDLALFLTARPRTTVVNGQNVRELSRVMQTFPDAQHPWVKDRSGKLPMEFPINLDDDYARIEALIFAEIPAEGAAVKGDPAAAPTPPAPPAAPAQATTKKAAATTKKAAAPAPAADKPAAAPAPAPEAAASPSGEETTPPEGGQNPDEAPAAEAPAEAPVETEKPAEAPPVEQPEPEAPQAEAPAETAPAPEAEAAVEDGSQAPAEATAEAPAEETVSSPETDSQSQPEAPAPPAEDGKPAWKTCGNCGGEVENKDQADLSFIRFRKHLCRSCFADAKKAKAS